MATTITLDEAWQRIVAAPLGRLPVEAVPLGDALGRHLAAAIATDHCWPVTDRSAMDGFACAAAGGLPAGTVLPVIGESLAGHPFAGALPPGSAIRIMTGAVVPPGADTVVPVESTSGFAGRTVTFLAAVASGQNIRRAGSEQAAGSVVLQPGTRLGPAEIGVLAVLGRTEVPVFARPRVAILATGDEVVPVTQAPLPHQVRESNSWALAAQVHELGGTPIRLGVAPDTEAALREGLAEGLGGADVVVTIGGISKGTHDLVHGVLQSLGVAVAFHGIELKPGKPTFFGQRPALAGGGDRPGERPVSVFGLPGNPASCFTVFDLLVRPLLLRLLGQQPPPWAAHATVVGVFRKNSRLQAVPARLVATRQGGLQAELHPPSPSGDPFGLLAANGYALLPPDLTPTPGLVSRVVARAAGLLP